MKYYNAFSLSLQKELDQRNLSMDSEINKSFKELKIRSLLHQSNIYKQKGYATVAILYYVLLLPFIQKYLTCFWNTEQFKNLIEAQKDTFYRFLNHERFNWRNFLYLLSIQIMARYDKAPLRDRVLIADDTITPKSGKNMELVSYHFDHKSRCSLLGYQCLQLAYHNALAFFPIDFAIYTSKNRPNNKIKKIDKRTNGYQRRKEALQKKPELLVAMLRRAMLFGMDASFVLFDSWFAHDAIIANILDIGYGVICRLKTSRAKYTYKGKQYTLKQLWKQVAKSKTIWIPKLNVKASALIVSLPKSGNVKIVFISNGKKQWQAFLCTDIELEPIEILTYYARRWTIEIFFKDAKQLLYLGKEQSRTFDAVIACYSLVMVRYLFLVYILNKYQIQGPLGPLFRDLSDVHLQYYMTEKVWMYIKELIVLSSHLFLTDFDTNKILQLIDIVEYNITTQITNFTAKL